MTTTGCLALSIPGRWLKKIRSKTLRFGLAAVAVAAAFGAPLTDSALSRVGQGITAFNAGNFPGAVQQLRGIQVSVPKLADYIVYDLASAEVQTGDIDGAIRDLAGYRLDTLPGSPLAGKLTLLYARTLLAKREPAGFTSALDVLQSEYKQLPQPEGDFALALAYEAVGERPQAVLSYESVYYSYPNTPLAAQAWTAMERLKPEIGPNFPKPTPRQQLERCEKWLTAKQYGKARQEYSGLAGQLTGPEKDDAKVGIGAADFLAGDANAALRYLKALHVTRSDADAQRLYYLTEAARKTGDDSEMLNAVKLLQTHYPKSVWRLKALVTVGNRYLLTHEREKYEPFYKAAFDTFPSDNSTAYCHWKITWDAYLANRADALDLLKEQVERYPADTRTSTALYFLGRLSEATQAYSDARAYYERLSAQYPHYFYGMLARERMADPKLRPVAPSETAVAWLREIDWPDHRDLSSTEANAATKLRVERFQLLTLAGLPDVAESDIRFGAKAKEERPQLLALELARSAPSPFRALRTMKSLTADYLALPLENAPSKFWQVLFPLPYRDDIVRNAREHGLDPYLVAALIRQETEFNPGAVSHASAYGLMQLVPSTGRMVGRQQGVRVSTASLLDPALNIRLGTQYVRSQLDSWSGKWEQALAAYNAGPGRVREWLGWGSYREPAEFIESIPFTETREYVQAVLRNADMYRQIYGAKPEAAPQQFASAAGTVALKPAVRYGAATAPVRKPVAAVRKVSARAHSSTSRKQSKSVLAHRSIHKKHVGA